MKFHISCKSEGDVAKKGMLKHADFMCLYRATFDRFEIDVFFQLET